MQVKKKELYGQTDFDTFSRLALEDDGLWRTVDRALRGVRSDAGICLHAGSRRVTSKRVRRVRRETCHRKVAGFSNLI